MIRRLLPYSLSTAGTLIVLPSVAADGTADADVVTGLANTGIGLFIIAIAGALLLTLVFRASAAHVARIVTEKIGKYRIHKILNARSPGFRSPLPPGRFRDSSAPAAGPGSSDR